MSSITNKKSSFSSDRKRAPALNLSPVEKQELYGIPLKYLSLVTLALQNASLSILMRYSRVSDPEHSYNPASAVLLTEILKASISLYTAYKRTDDHALNSNREDHLSPLFPKKKKSFLGNLPVKPSASHNKRRISLSLKDDQRPSDTKLKAKILVAQIFSRDSWKLSIPAILYVIQNNLAFVAASNLEVATFQVAYQMKILTTALFSVVLLGRSLTKTKWLSLVFLAIGVGIVQVQSTTMSSSQGGVHAGNPITGFMAVAMACLTSGLAGVYFELVLKGSNVDLWVRNVQLSLFSFPPALLPVLFGQATHGLGLLERLNLVRNFNVWAYATVLTQVLGGLVTALVIKYSDNILKGFATSISIVISSVASVILFDFPITPGFVMGASTVLGSTMIYNKPSAAAAASNKGVPASSNKIGDNFASYNMEKEKNSNNDIRNSPSPIEAKSMLNVSDEKHKSTFVPAHEMPGPTYNVYSNNDTSHFTGRYTRQALASRSITLYHTITQYFHILILILIRIPSVHDCFQADKVATQPQEVAEKSAPAQTSEQVPPHIDTSSPATKQAEPTTSVPAEPANTSQPVPQVPEATSPSPPTSIQRTPTESKPQGVADRAINGDQGANLQKSPSATASARGAERVSQDQQNRLQDADARLGDDDRRAILMNEGKDAKQVSKILEAEAKNDAAALKDALKDAEKAQKLSAKAEKSITQANGRLEKSIKSHHEIAKKLERLKSDFESSERQREQRQRELELKKQHKAEIDALVDERMERVDRLTNGKAITDRERTVQRRNTVNPKK
ncbi:hypothetical protein E3P92_00152 [Wallemia ichthyophaga]|nr:hypothetical protein E3P92_00152 [Wallemia ichthyophaga]